MIKELKRKFKNYIYKNYDINDKSIKGKYNHSKRVMKLSIKIAKSLNLTKEDLEIIIVGSLLHDIGRFKEWELYNSYDVSKPRDHAKMGVDILFKENLIKEFYLNTNNYNSIFNIIYNHNKKEIDTNLTSKDKLLSNIIRDADKIDILHSVQTKEIPLGTYTNEITPKIKEDFFNHKLINNKDLTNNSEHLIRKLSFIYDINYKYSYKYLYKNKIINNISKLINNKDINPYINELNNYIKLKLNKYFNK